MRISFIIPVCNEKENIAVLYERLSRVVKDMSSYEVEYIFIDDFSTDNSFEILKNISKKDKRLKILKLSRNFGSYIASVAGLSYASGDAVVVMSADMQEPPELVPALLKKWQEGYEIVWAVREERDESRAKIFFANLYYFIMQKIALRNLPTTGSDMFLIDRKVVSVVVSTKEKNSTLLGLICWSGFNQATISYKREKRKFGKSKWTFPKQIKFAVDSFVSFSYLPVRLSSYLGFFISFIGFLYALFIIVRGFFYKQTVAGWSPLMVILLIVSGIQLLILGILGEFLWRNLEESRKRPLFIISEWVGFNNDSPSV